MNTAVFKILTVNHKYSVKKWTILIIKVNSTYDHLEYVLQWQIMSSGVNQEIHGVQNVENQW